MVDWASALFLVSSCSGQILGSQASLLSSSVPSSSGHKVPQLCGKERHFAGSPYACQSWTGTSTFRGCAAENTPLRQSVLCLSNPNGRFHFSFCPVPMPSPSRSLRTGVNGIKRHSSPVRSACRGLRGHLHFSILQICKRNESECDRGKAWGAAQ